MLLPVPLPAGADPAPSLAFADTPLTGNPLPVVADAEPLEERVMRAVASEFKQSETDVPAIADAARNDLAAALAHRLGNSELDSLLEDFGLVCRRRRAAECSTASPLTNGSGRLAASSPG